eukprot:7345959-Pyramimonas_sp.AAC.1
MQDPPADERRQPSDGHPPRRSTAIMIGIITNKSAQAGQRYVVRIEEPAKTGISLTATFGSTT